MDIMALGAIGELVGGVAVIGSLVFVGLQLRANTRTLGAEASTRSQLEWSSFNTMISQHPDRAALVRMFEPDASIANFGPEDRAAVVFIARAFAQQVEAQYFQFRAGLLDPEVWEARLRGFGAILNMPAFREWWNEEEGTPLYTRSFLDLVAATRREDIAPEVLAGTFPERP